MQRQRYLDNIAGLLSSLGLHDVINRPELVSKIELGPREIRIESVVIDLTIRVTADPTPVSDLKLRSSIVASGMVVGKKHATCVEITDDVDFEAGTRRFICGPDCP